QAARVIKELLKNTNRRVFKYRNGDGKFVNVTGRSINQFIQETMGRSFSAKDFRTWAGTLVCACALARIHGTEEAGDEATKRQIVKAIDETADALGNTPAVSRKSYVCPAVISSYEKGEVLDCYFEKLDKLMAYRGVK